MGQTVRIGELADTVMETLEEYADLAAEDVKQAVRNAGETVSDYSGQLAHALKRVQRMGSAV